MQNQTRPSCFARMLDVRSYVVAARGSMSNADPAACLFLIVVFGLIGACLFPLWLTFDLGSTWSFTSGLRDAARPAISDTTAQIDSYLQMSIGAALAGVILTAFTLLPSLFELAFPTVSHPLLTLVLTCSIVFDYVTDWQKSSELVSTWMSSTFYHFVTTVFVCAFMSVGVQALLVVSVTVVIFGTITIIRGGGGGAGRVVTIQQ
ncbi:MAG: hypothetical protein WCK70_12515 [Chloroflexales bacterium]